MEASVYSTNELLLSGYSPAMIRSALEAGTLHRVRRGWYALSGASVDVITALRVGAHLGCVSGCSAYGLWVPHTRDLHAVYAWGSRPTPRPGVTLHSHPGPAPTSAVWPLGDCLEQVLRRHDVETSLIVVESAVDKGLLHQEEAEAMVRRTANGDLRHLLARAKSGSETRVRLFFRRRRVPVQALTHVKDVGEVDLLVGNKLIVECDSRAHHTSLEDRFLDGNRDINAHLGGYQRIRLSYKQIWHRWEATQQFLIAAIRQRRHIRRGQSRNQR